MRVYRLTCFCSVPITAGNKLASKEVGVTADICFNKSVTNGVSFWLLQEHCLRNMPFETDTVLFTVASGEI
jgi:hypothetical protein